MSAAVKPIKPDTLEELTNEAYAAVVRGLGAAQPPAAVEQKVAVTDYTKLADGVFAEFKRYVDARLEQARKDFIASHWHPQHPSSFEGLLTAEKMILKCEENLLSLGNEVRKLREDLQRVAQRIENDRHGGR